MGNWILVFIVFIKILKELSFFLYMTKYITILLNISGALFPKKIQIQVCGATPVMVTWGTQEAAKMNEGLGYSV